MTAYPRLTATAKAPSPAKTITALACGAALACALLLSPGQALAINDDAVLKHMDTVLEENTRLHEEAWKARKHGPEAARQATEAVNASDERLERTRTEALAHVAGVSPAQVEGLRKNGRSWGQAAGDLGVHPGFLGIGKAPLYESLPKRKAADDTRELKGKRVKKGQPQAKAKAKVGSAAGKKSQPKAKVRAATKTPDKNPPKTHKKSNKSAKKD